MHHLGESIGNGAMLLLLLASGAAAGTVTVSFTGSNGRTLLHRYSLEVLPQSAELPGVFRCFHGDIPGTQQA